MDIIMNWLYMSIRHFTGACGLRPIYLKLQSCHSPSPYPSPPPLPSHFPSSSHFPFSSHFPSFSPLSLSLYLSLPLFLSVCLCLSLFPSVSLLLVSAAANALLSAVTW